MSPWIGIALVLVGLAALMAGVHALQRRAAVSAELARKLVHMGMGAICLTLPWVFQAAWPAWVLAVVAVGEFLAVKWVPALRVRLGSVLGGVGRASLGELYFPLGVAVVFTLAQGRPAFYCVPVAILAFADAAGALVGQRWGRTRYQAVENTKSVEGSAAVLVVTWLCTTAGLMTLTNMPWLPAGLTGLGLGIFAMLVEAVSWRGLDNLLLPVAAFAQLEMSARLGLGELALRPVVLTLMTVIMIFRPRRAMLDDSARLGAALGVYLYWSIGGWRWLVAPAALLVSYTRLMPSVPGGPPRHNLMAIICVGLAGLPWSLAQAVAPDDRWLWLFTLGLATQQAMIAAVRFSQGRPAWRPWQWWGLALLQALAVQGVAFVGVNGWLIPPLSLLVGASALSLALAAFMAWEPRLSLPDDLNERWWRQGITGVLAALAGFVALRS